MTQEALKLALDALETELSIDWTNNDEFNASAEKMYEAIAAIKQALLQPEQEPVGYWKEHAQGMQRDYDLLLADNEKLAQRTWVGLTVEEVEKIWQGVEASDFHDCVQPFAQAIGNILKEKNFV